MQLTEAKPAQAVHEEVFLSSGTIGVLPTGWSNDLDGEWML